MNQHYTNYLFRKYAPLYQGKDLPLTKNLMGFGFSCGDGWFNLINGLSYELCTDWLYANSIYNNRLGREGQLIFPKAKESEYNHVITPSHIRDLKEIVQQKAEVVPVAIQVKEKFGTLRFYCNNTTEEHRNYIDFAERLSASTCEICGARGKTGGRGWIKTLCKKHRKLQNERES